MVQRPPLLRPPFGGAGARSSRSSGTPPARGSVRPRLPARLGSAGGRTMRGLAWTATALVWSAAAAGRVAAEQAPPGAAELAAQVQAIQRADYRGEREALRRLANEVTK